MLRQQMPGSGAIQAYRRLSRSSGMLFATFSVERERWFLWIPPVFALGIAAYFKLRWEPGWLASFVPIVICAVLVWLLRSSRFNVIVHAALIAAAGFGVAKLRTESVRAPVLVQVLPSAEVVGVLERVERRHGGGQRLTLRIKEIKGLAPQWTPQRVRVRVRKATTQLAPGQTVRIRVRLSPPPPPALPRGYDFARAAYFQGLGAVGFALAAPKLANQQTEHDWFGAIVLWLERLRLDIGRRIETALPGEVGAIANALMTGERSGISEATNDLYRDAGIFHILSISGLHMAIMGGSVFAALRFLLALFPGIALRYPIKKWSAVAAAVATFAYLLISGGAYPTVRSFFMILIMFLAIVLDRPAIALRNVAIAALLILSVMPESLFNAGFQLSFAAVVGLVAAYEAYRERSQRRRRLGHSGTPPTGPWRWLGLIWTFAIGTVATTLIAGLATAPFAAFHFHTAQLYSVLTNLLAIPASNLIVMPAALAAFIALPLGLEGVPLAVMGWGIDIMTWSARSVTRLAGAVVAVPAYSEASLQLMVAGGLWLCLWRQVWRWLGIVLALVGIWSASESHRPVGLIGRDGTLVALRDANGQFTAQRMRRARFEMSRWLEHDGDRRTPAEAWRRGGRNNPFRCDLEGCMGPIGDLRIAMPRSPAALVDDCRRANILVLTFPKPKGCVTHARVFDYHALKRSGTHALYFEDSQLRVETVEQFRGRRPWTVATRLADQSAYWRSRRTAARDTILRRARTIGPETAGKPLEDLRPELDGGHPLYWFN